MTFLRNRFFRSLPLVLGLLISHHTRHFFCRAMFRVLPHPCHNKSLRARLLICCHQKQSSRSPRHQEWTRTDRVSIAIGTIVGHIEPFVTTGGAGAGDLTPVDVGGDSG